MWLTTRYIRVLLQLKGCLWYTEHMQGLSETLECDHHVLLCHWFEWSQLCLNKHTQKKGPLSWHFILCIKADSFILLQHVTATCGFEVPRLYGFGSEAKLKVEPGLRSVGYHLWPGMFQLPCNAHWQGKGGAGNTFYFNKWALRQLFIDWKIGAPGRSECLEMLTLLPYRIPNQSDGHSHLCQITPR